ncbi:MAG: class I SAM-dependent methyltransferase [Acidobacteriota bacterium]
MEEAQYHLLARVEAEHWWHRTLRQAVGEALDQHAATSQRRLELLDIGCGTGGLLQELAERHQVVGVDRSPLAVGYARQRGLPRIATGSVEALPFASERFDAAVSIDVLSHRSIGSELYALGEISRILRPGGVLVLQLSAFEWLRGEHDREVHQERRYRRGQVVAMLGGAGFTTLEARYRLAFLPPLMVLNNLSTKLSSRDTEGAVEREPDLALPSPALNRLLLTAARIDLSIGGWLPVGSSVFCVARKD